MTLPRPRLPGAVLLPLVGGAMLVLLGAALLADQLGLAVPYRWMFLALLVPAAAAIADAIRVAGWLGWRHIQPVSRLIAAVLFAAIGMLWSLIPASSCRR